MFEVPVKKSMEYRLGDATALKVLYPVAHQRIRVRDELLERRDVWFSRTVHDMFGVQIDDPIGYCRISMHHWLDYRSKARWAVKVDACEPDAILVNGWVYPKGEVSYTTCTLSFSGEVVASFLLSSCGIIKNKYNSKREQYHIWQNTATWLQTIPPSLRPLNGS